MLTNFYNFCRATGRLGTATFASLLLATSLTTSADTLAQTIELTPPPGARVAGDLAQAEQRRLQELFDSATQKRRQNQLPAALIDAEAGLLLAPRDLQLRFLRAGILQQQGQLERAQQVFIALAQEFPEVPEVHNNLAVIYAQKGQLTEAKAALERAIAVFPGYAVAHENLGDVYLRLAQQSYARSNQANAKAPSVQNKLKLTTDWLRSVGLIAN
jgi:tetratricopeptide (TPR) repeat protein